MKKVIKTAAILLLFWTITLPVSAREIYYDIYTASDTTIGSTTIDGDFIVAYASWTGELSLSGSFTGWEDLGGYTDLTATMTFTWHDDDNLNWYGGSSIGSDVNNFDLTDFYPDLAMVSLDGTTVFENVEVGVYGSTDTSVYVYTLTDLSLLEDGILNYLVQAGLYSSARTDFIVDSVSLSITGNPVPVPGALYLLGGGLVWLLGIKRNHCEPDSL